MLRVWPATLFLAIGGCGLVLDLDPPDRSPLDGGSMDAGRARDAGPRDATDDARAIPLDARRIDAPFADGAGCTFERCNALDDDCDGAIDEEVDVSSDAFNCGACGRVCPGAPFAATACEGGDCVLVCESTHANCDARDDTGCETSIRTTSNCGACGAMCATGQSCVGGVCMPTTTDCVERTDCNGNAADGCETDTRVDLDNCGACGIRCGAREVCCGCCASADLCSMGKIC